MSHGWGGVRGYYEKVTPSTTENGAMGSERWVISDRNEQSHGRMGRRDNRSKEGQARRVWVPY